MITSAERDNFPDNHLVRRRMLRKTGADGAAQGSAEERSEGGEESGGLKGEQADALRRELRY